MTENVKKKRITVVLAKPNPLFEQWLAEWKEEAKQKGSKMERTFAYALTNLRKCTIPLNSGRECKIIKGFGDKLCKMLDDKLAQYNRTQENTSIGTLPKMMNVSPQKQIQKKDYISRESCSSEYIPKYRSGGYAILLALQSSSPYLLTKEEIIHLGKQFSNHSFIKPDPGSYYTAWSSMKILLEKGLVSKQGKPAKYSLSEKGHNIARKLSEENSNSSVNNHNGLKLITTENSPSIISNALEEITMACKIDELPEKHEQYFNIPASDISLKRTLQIENNDIIELIDDCDDDLIQNALLSDSDNCTNQLRISSHQIDLPSIQTLKNIIPQDTSANTTNPICSDKISNHSIQNLDCLKNVISIKKFISADSLSIKKSVNNNLSSKNLKKCSSSNSVAQSSEQEECFIFEPNSFDVILYVDNQETTG